MSELGKVITRLREGKRWTQGQLALRSGVNSSHISRIESGDRKNPTIETIAKLARALGVSIDYLFQEAGLLPKQETGGILYPELQQIQRILDEMPPSERVVSQGILEGIGDLLRQLLAHTQTLRRDENVLGLLAEELESTDTARESPGEEAPDEPEE